MAAHRGIGNRLLDGRQIMIMSLMEQGLIQQATAMIESSVPTEPWENTVATILRIHCRPKTPTSQKELDYAVQETLTLVTQPEPTTAAFRARLGLTTLDLTAHQPTPYDSRLRDAVTDVASSDAYAARDVLGHHGMRSQITDRQEQELTAVLTASGLGAKYLSAAHTDALAAAVRTAEDRSPHTARHHCAPRQCRSGDRVGPHRRGADLLRRPVMLSTRPAREDGEIADLLTRCRRLIRRRSKVP